MASYKPFAQTNYVDEDNNNNLNSLSSIDEEIIKIPRFIAIEGQAIECITCCQVITSLCSTSYGYY